MNRTLLALCLLSLQLISLIIPQSVNAWCGRPYCYDCNQEDDGVCHLLYGAEALFWIAYQTELDYAVDLELGDDFILGRGKTHCLDYGWKTGVRAWFGWNWDHGWDLKVYYTYFSDQAKGKKDYSRDGGGFALKPSLLHPETLESIATKASGKLNLEYQTIDAVFGKVICFCDNQFVLHPFFGARGLKLNQLLKTLYEGGDFVLLLNQPFVGGDLATPGQVKWNSSTMAAGIRAGMDMHLRSEIGLGLYGTFGGSILTSRADNKHKQRLLDSEGDDFLTQIDLEEKQWLSLPGLDVAAGIGWDLCFNGCLYLKLKLGYEFNKWFNVQQVRRYHFGNAGVSSNNTSGNLTLHGCVVSAEIYF